MKVEYNDNPALGPGNGMFIFSDAVIPDGPWSVIITRSSDHNNLTGKKNNMWIGESYYLPLNGKVLPDGSLALYIGPAIVNALDQRETYRITLKSDYGKEQKALLQLATVPIASVESADNTANVGAVAEERVNLSPPPSAVKSAAAAAAAEAAEAQVAQAAPEAPSAPEAQENLSPLPDVAAAEAAAHEADLSNPFEEAGANYNEASESDSLDAGQSEETDGAGMSLPEESYETEKKRSLWWLWLILLILFLGALGVGGWFAYDKYFYKFFDKTPPVDTSAPAPEAPKSVETPPVADRSKTARQQVDLFFQGQNVDPEQAYRLSQELPRGSQADQDAVYRLLYFASQNDVPGASLQLGDCLDPSTAAFGSINKDGAEAAAAYKKAEKTEPEKARAALNKLMQWLENQANAGNQQARQWLSQIGR